MINLKRHFSWRPRNELGVKKDESAPLLLIKSSSDRKENSENCFTEARNYLHWEKLVSLCIVNIPLASDSLSYSPKALADKNATNIQWKKTKIHNQLWILFQIIFAKLSPAPNQLQLWMILLYFYSTQLFCCFNLDLPINWVTEVKECILKWNYD